jgi:hypothetical protein
LCRCRRCRCRRHVRQIAKPARRRSCGRPQHCRQFGLRLRRGDRRIRDEVDRSRSRAPRGARRPASTWANSTRPRRLSAWRQPWASTPIPASPD